MDGLSEYALDGDETPCHHDRLCVLVKWLSGKQVEIQIDGTALVQDLKVALEIEGIPAPFQMLIWGTDTELDWGVRHNAVKALQQISSPDDSQSIDSLKMLMKDSSCRVRVAVFLALMRLLKLKSSAKCDDPILNELKESLKDTGPKHRRAEFTRCASELATLELELKSLATERKLLEDAVEVRQRAAPFAQEFVALGSSVGQLQQELSQEFEAVRLLHREEMRLASTEHTLEQRVSMMQQEGAPLVTESNLDLDTPSQWICAKKTFE
eukprot:g13590.t1